MSSGEIMRNIYLQQAMDGGIAIGEGRKRHATAYKKTKSGKQRASKFAPNPKGKYYISHRNPSGTISKSIAPSHVYAAEHNPWLIHVKKFRKAHPHLSYKEALIEARKSYHRK